MPTRRAIVLGTIATGIAVRTGRVLAKASQLATPVNFDVPAGACDCHTHIFGAASGIGRATALIFTREGAPNVVCADINDKVRLQLSAGSSSCSTLRAPPSGAPDFLRLTIS